MSQTGAELPALEPIENRDGDNLFHDPSKSRDGDHLFHDQVGEMPVDLITIPDDSAAEVTATSPATTEAILIQDSDLDEEASRAGESILGTIARNINEACDRWEKEEDAD